MLERRAAARGPGGTLYFGGRDGVTEIHPDHIRDNTAVPPVVLTGFRLNGKPVSIASGGAEGAFALPRHIGEARTLVLPPETRGLTFEFAALDFTAPDKNRYAYWMEGFDEDWIQAGTQRSATYTNLDPGRYVFHVRAANNDDVWNEEGPRLSITIRPPWYRTRWAYALYVLLAVGSAVGFIYVRERRLRRQTRILETTVTERTEQLARQTEALRKANAFKSRFLTNISHEFRTPLTLILGPINDVLDGRHRMDAASRPHFERARRNGHRLLRLINQLLELARLDAGALHLDANRHDLARHLRDIAALFEDIARQHRIRFLVDVPAEPLRHVFDADKVEHVVVNLLSNAIKFTPPEGAVSFGLVQEADGTARLTVADTGQGIPEEHLPRLFDRFYQVESAATRRHEGSGIGLSRS
jgi:signal transduction histidine kinase